MCGWRVTAKNFSRSMERLTRSSRTICVVADQERAVGIGGVMGGEETGVTDSTKNILLEAAYFLPASIRRTARNLNLPSDASYRFERGVDPEMVFRASQRADRIDSRDRRRNSGKGNCTSPASCRRILPMFRLSYEKCDRVVGVAIKPKTVDEILTQIRSKENRSTSRR